VHEVSVRCTQLQFAWQKYADIVVELSAAFPEQALQASWYALPPLPPSGAPSLFADTRPSTPSPRTIIIPEFPSLHGLQRSEMRVLFAARKSRWIWYSHMKPRQPQRWQSFWRTMWGWVITLMQLPS